MDLYLNFISIICNVILACLTYKMVCSTKESVEEMKKTRVESNSAEVIMYFVAEYGRIYLIVENTGNTVAKDVSIEFEPKLKDSHNNSYEFLKEFSFLPPNYKIKCFFDMGANYLNEKNPIKYTFIITFTNIYNDKIKRKYINDLNHMKNLYYLGSESDSVEMSLTKIKKELKNTNDYLKKLNK